MVDEKTMAVEKVSVASIKCEYVHKKLHDAHSELTKNVYVNGFGIYQDRFQIRNQILSTKAFLEDALRQLDSVDWPTNEDYDEL